MRKKMSRMLALLVCISMILTGLPGMTAYAAPTEGEQTEESIDPAQTETQAPADMEDLDPSTLGVHKLGEITEDEEEEVDLSGLTPDTSLTKLVRVSVFLEEPSALDAGYSAQGVGQNPSANDYRAALRSQQRSVQAAIEGTVGYSLDVVWNLTLLTNAFSAYVYKKDIPLIERMDGVKAVELENQYTVSDTETAQPNTSNTSVYMTGAANTWTAGYTGAGTRIAIIDTGIDTTHQSFDEAAFNHGIEKYTADTGKTPVLMTRNDIPAGLNGSGAYVSSKIPYAYNYVDRNNTVNHLSDTQGEHGSHVAGIAAANRFVKSGNSYEDAAETVKAVGMAPDAQLLVMKVFGSNGGAYDSDYFAAIEDAVAMDADAINLSLGSGTAGFTYSNEYQAALNELSDRSKNAGSLVAISAGNAGAITDNLYTDLYIDDVSLHTGGSPGTYINSMGVASADNTGNTGTPLYFNGSQSGVYYTDGNTASGGKMTSVAGSYDFVYIDAIGDASDYSTVNAAVSLSGKVVIVNRGSSTFVEKGNNAIDYSPKALLIANNQPGTISMSLDDFTGTFPMASITLADANALKEASVQNTAGSVTYYTGTVQVTSVIVTENGIDRDDATMSSFSSWGIPGSLLMKPDITAPGGNIYSVFGTNKTKNGQTGGSDQYELMSGTSMAAPHIAGLAALAAQYLKESAYEQKNASLAQNYSRRAVMQSLLMSTATPMTNDGSYASILHQGAGLADISKAVTAASVIMMNEAGLTTATGAAADGKVKAELGDDPDRDGVYSYSFTIYNIADKDLTFNLSTDMFTQAYYVSGEDVDYGEDGFIRADDIFMSQGTRALDAGVSYSYANDAADSHDVNKDGVTDPADAQALLDYLSGENDGSALNTAAGEAEGDGTLSTHDAYTILQGTTAADGLVVKKGSSKTVTVSIALSEAEKAGLDALYTGGAYIEGFTKVDCVTADFEGVSYAHTHTIPILGFYGSWTDASMFDNTSYTDGLYDTAKIPYTGNSDTNYVTLKYGGTMHQFSGNPYMVEEEFPADALAVNSTNSFGNLYYNLVRSAGTTGFAVTKTDGIGGDVTDILSSSISGNEVDGIWYYDEEATWQNTGRKSLTVGKTAASYGLAEGDTFRLGFYAIPEYYGMISSSDMTASSAGILSLSGFNSGLIDNVFGKGAYVGYDFTVDDTNPVIDNISLNTETGELSVSASDNRNLAYVAVISLDGNMVYSETAPHAGEYEGTIDATEAIEHAAGYVAVFVADYAGNETAKAVKVNDNTAIITTKTIYVRTNTVTSGNDYLIVNSNTVGNGYALGHNNATAETDPVEILAGNEGSGNAVYIEEVDSSAVWTASGSSSSLQLKNGRYYISRSNRNLSFVTTQPKNGWSWLNNRLSQKSGNSTYYLRFANNAFSVSTNQSSIYLYEKRTITTVTEADPNAVSSVSITPETLDLYKGNEVDLSAEILPLTVENRNVNWTSSNPSVVTVDGTGHVTAVATGSATITAAAASDETKTAACTVNVISANKNLNGIVWDENGEVYFSGFNTDTLPAWNKLHNTKATQEVQTAFMASSSSLYAGTVDTSSQQTILYSVNRTNYALTEYGENYVLATDLAPGVSGSNYSSYVGMVYPFATYLLGGPVAPEDDGEGGTYSGVPYAMLNCSETLGGAYLAGIAVRQRGTSSASYYLLDENGIIWQTTLSIGNNGFEFSTPTKVVETGIGTSFLYQSLYYDGTYLYWSHYADNDTTLYVINPSNGKVYNAGSFGDGIWPVGGLYVNGSVAPAETGDSTAAIGNLQPLNISRSSLMTPEVMNRFAAEAARVGVRRASIEQPVVAAPAAAQPAPQEVIPESTPEPEPAVPEETTEPVSGFSEEAAPAEEESIVPDGTLNAVTNHTVRGKITGVRRAVSGAAELVTSNDEAVITLTEDENVTNGKMTVSYPANLTFTGADSPLYFSAHNDEENHTVTVTYAAISAVPAEEELVKLHFTGENLSGVATVTVSERNETISGITEEPAEIIFGGPEFMTHSLVLSGEIGVNFFLSLPEIAGIDYTDSYMEFTVSGKGGKTTTDPFDPTFKSTSGKYYGFTCYVNSIQMADQIEAVFHYGNGQTITKTYSVDAYIQTFMNNQDLFTEEAVALVMAIADYGHYAQLALSESRGWSIGTDYAEMSTYYTQAEALDLNSVLENVKEYAINIDKGNSDVDKVTYALDLESQTSVFIYLKMNDGYSGEVTASIDGGSAVPAERLADGRYRVRIDRISAHNLGRTYNIVVTTASGTASIAVSALSYVYTVLNMDSASENLKNVMAVIYNYYVKTVAYKKANQ